MDLMIKENNNIVRQDIITQSDGFEVSSKYVPIATQDVLNEIESIAGSVNITGFNTANVRKPGKDGFQKHAVICQLENAEMLDGTKMNMIIFNSNDRSTALKIFLGSVRMACSNQMVWGKQIAEPINIRHSKKDWKHSIASMMEEYEENQKNVNDMIERMLRTRVTHQNMAHINHRVVEEILNPEITGIILDPSELNLAHRKEDLGVNAWKYFNRVQYNMMNGGVHRIVEKSDENGLLFDHVSKTFKVKEEKKKIDFNTKLHEIIMEEI